MSHDKILWILRLHNRPPTNRIMSRTRQGKSETTELVGISDHSCEIGISQIPNGGLGLFATRDIKYGEVVTAYFGFICQVTSRLSLEQQKYCIDTTFKGRNKSLVGFSEPKMLMLCRKKRPQLGFGLAQMANDALIPCITGFSNNSVFQQRGNQIVLRAVRPIMCSEEIFTSYGADYWLPIGLHQICKDSAKLHQWKFTIALTELLEDALQVFVLDIRNFQGTVCFHLIDGVSGAVQAFSEEKNISDPWLPHPEKTNFTLHAHAKAILPICRNFKCHCCGHYHPAPNSEVQIRIAIVDYVVAVWVQSCDPDMARIV